jgi:hypothetical protein
LEWILLYKFKSDRIDRIIRIFFCLHQFPEEIDEKNPINPACRAEASAKAGRSCLKKNESIP